MKLGMSALTLLLALSATLVFAAGSDTKSESGGGVAMSAAAARPLAVGDKAPAVVLKDIDGNAFDLRAALAEKPAALVFYRGGWCPFCSTHLANVQKAEKDILAKGYQILAISPDKPEELRESVAKGTLTYALLSDSDMAAARAFGLAFRLDKDTLDKYEGYGIDLAKASGGGNQDTLPVPAFYLIGKDGTIQFEHHDPNYMKRIATADILAALEKAEN